MNLLKLSNKYVFACCLLFTKGMSAQKTVQEYKLTYPNINELILSNNQSYDFSFENKKLKVIQDNHFESIILSENGILNNKESFSYSELVKLKDYSAYSVNISNGHEKKRKVTQTSEKNYQQNSVFYNDVKERQLVFPNLETGSRKVFDYQTEYIDPFLLHKFVFGNDLPIQNSTLEIRTEKNINIGYKVFNDPTNSIVFSKTEKKGKWNYTWTMTDIKPLKFEENMPGFLHIVPHIDVYITDYNINDKKTEVLGDVNGLYNYYKGFVKNLNKTEDPELKAITLELTADKSTAALKMKSIFYWVKDNIKYIAFENGYEGFIPREASLVFERKFGDCKDMASIITAMAKYAGVNDVNISWIGTRDIPYSYSQLATPAVDDHMIAVFNDNGNYIFLDATDKETIYGIPTAFIQGKEALVYNGDNFKIVPVPIVAPEKNEIAETVKLSIVKDKLIGSGIATYSGFARSHYLAQIGDDSDKQRFDMIKSLIIKGNNKFNLTDFTEENIKDRDKPYIVNYNFNIDNYIIRVNKDLYINLFLDKIYQKLNIEKDRVSKYDFDFLTHNTSNYELEIPENYAVKYLPDNFILDNALLKASFIFEVTKNKLNLKLSLTMKKMILEKSDFELWNQSIKKLKSAYTETIILSQKP